MSHNIQVKKNLTHLRIAKAFADILLFAELTYLTGCSSYDSYTIKRNKNATLFLWKIHELLFKALDRAFKKRL